MVKLFFSEKKKLSYIHQIKYFMCCFSCCNGNFKIQAHDSVLQAPGVPTFSLLSIAIYTEVLQLTLNRTFVRKGHMHSVPLSLTSDLTRSNASDSCLYALCALQRFNATKSQISRKEKYKYTKDDTQGFVVSLILTTFKMTEKTNLLRFKILAPILS